MVIVGRDKATTRVATVSGRYGNCVLSRRIVDGIPHIRIDRDERLSIREHNRGHRTMAENEGEANVIFIAEIIGDKFKDFIEVDETRTIAGLRGRARVGIPRGNYTVFHIT